MQKRSQKKWQPGDLVLHKSAPKTHSMLMEVLEVNGTEARTRYLDPMVTKGWWTHRTQSGACWYAMEELFDPAAFLRTDEYLQTLRDQMQRKNLKPLKQLYGRQRE